MEIYSGKEIIKKTKKDIPELEKSIWDKTQELKNLLAQEKTPALELRWNAYVIFQKTRKEILSLLHILDTLWYSGDARIWRISKVWPFMEMKKLDINNPTIRKELKQIALAQKEILNRKNVDREKLSNRYITI